MPKIMCDQRTTRFSHSIRCASKVSSPVSAGRVEQPVLGLGEEMFITVVAGAGAVDHQEVVLGGQAQQRVVPYAFAVVDALATIAEKGPHLVALRLLGGRRDDDQERLATQRHEGLAAQWVPF